MHCTLTGICTVHQCTFTNVKIPYMQRDVACIVTRFHYKILSNIFVNTRKSGDGYYRSSGLATTNARTTHHSRVFYCVTTLCSSHSHSGLARTCERDSTRGRAPCLAVKHTITHDVTQNDMVILTCAATRPK